MSFESDNAQRNTTLDRLKQRTPPTLTDQQPNVLYTMPITTVERLEEVLRRTLTLQETIRADTERLATKENLKELATGQQLVDWLNQINSIHQGICRDLRQTVQEMKEEHKQDGKRRDGFMRELSELEAQFRRNWDEASARFQGKILLTILASGIVSAVVSVGQIIHLLARLEGSEQQIPVQDSTTLPAHMDRKAWAKERRHRMSRQEAEPEEGQKLL